MNNNADFLIKNVENKNSESKCIVVVGVARGGTSAIASSLSSIGIYMGDEARSPTYEDHRLINCIPSKVGSVLSSKAWNQFSIVASGYSQSHDQWGFKYPNIHKHLPKIHSVLDRPKYIFVYRDILAIANRRSDIHSESYIDSQYNCLRIYKNIVSFVEKYSPYSLHVSYEKLLLNKEVYIESLSEFCGTELSEAVKISALKSIEASPRDYVQWSQHQKQVKRFGNTSYKGVVQSVTTEKVVGWACDTSSEEPVSVDIVVNGKVIKKCIANQHRQKIFRKFSTPTPLVGFQCIFDAPLSSSVSIKVVISDTEVELINSGKTISEY